MDNKRQEARRLPEDTVRAMHFAHSLHARVGARAKTLLSWRERSAVRAQAANLSTALKGRVLEVVAKAPERHDALLSFVSGPLFEGASTRLQQAILDGLTRDFDAALLENLSKIMSGPGFQRMNPNVQAELVKGFCRLDETRRAPMTELFELPGLLSLKLDEQLDVVRYLGGPVAPDYAPASRQSFLDEAWDDRRTAMIERLEGEELQEAGEVEQAEMILDFLYLPTQEVYFLESRAYRGRSILVFGDPAAAPRLSYVQRYMIRAGARVGAKIDSPDECVSSSWNEGGEDAQATYAFTRMELGRDEERRFVEWVESSHIINEDQVNQTALGPRLKYINCRRFFTTALKVGRMMASKSGGVEEEGQMYAGECLGTTGAESDRFVGELLGEYLSA